MTFTIQSKDDFANNRVHGYYESERNEFQGEWFRSNIDMRNNEDPFLVVLRRYGRTRVLEALDRRHCSGVPSMEAANCPRLLSMRNRGCL